MLTVLIPWSHNFPDCRFEPHVPAGPKDDDCPVTKKEALPLRFFLGLFAFAALVIQLVVVPRVGASYASVYPDVAYLEPLYVTAVMVALVGLLVALFAAWQVVSGALAARGVPSRPAGWANIMTASLIFLVLIFAGVFVHAGSVANVGGPAMLLGVLVCVAFVPVAFALRRWVINRFTSDSLYAPRGN
ncbi:Uncharacterised protein [Arthrobacter agilis]|nr:Uncharacterised protein [Arthrobacter agilis]